MSVDLSRMRNIGISAHIDSGKTTLTERILFYTDRIHAIHDVRGKDGVGAKMDNMDLERERGITIQSAATHVTWDNHHVNIIDTPGHVDFTVEVERALRVLDGAVLVLCGVAGVQSQSLTVDRQMKRYKVPRLAFVNKCDRSGANPFRVTQQLIDKLSHNAVMMQIPVGLENEHRGIVDLVTMRSYIFEGENGENIVEGPIPDDLLEQARESREIMLDAASLHCDDLMEAMLEDKVTEELIHDAVRRATIAQDMTPVFMGSAYKNKGVQRLLDAVVRYLPAPPDVPNTAIELDKDGEEVGEFIVPSNSSDPLIMLAFKLEDGRYGQLTYLRIYQGTLRRDDFVVNKRNRKRLKVGRIVRMHSSEMEDIQEATAGDIIAMFGVDCYSGDTFVSADRPLPYVMSSMHVPDSVIHVSITPVDNKAQTNMSKALQRFTKEDPTFRVGVDEESGETIISGMGELHLEVYIERMKREYGAEVTTSPPQVAYRETITQKADYSYVHKKQTGGSGQYGKIIGWIGPDEEENYSFNDSIKGGNIPKEFIPSVNKGFRSMMGKGLLIGFPVVGVHVELTDGSYHSVDSSDNAFQAAARGAWRETFSRAKPAILEPLMKVELEGPVEFHGNMVGTLMSRRGQIVGTVEEDEFSRIEAEVPLAEMFGYATVLRSGTQGKANFTMEFKRYSPVPQSVREELIEKAAKAKAAERK